MEFAGISMPSWDDMELLSSPSRGGPHRRVRSDPSDIMQALRAERAQWGGSEPMLPGAPKRDLSPMESGSGMSPAYKKHAPSHPDVVSMAPYQPKLFRTVSDGPTVPEPAMALPCDPDSTGSFGDAADDDIDATGKSKKDVPMWTVEEDLLILQLVEKHGKRWSKIAMHLPGRTDNGVRNRWNRMERAQVLRQRRGPEAGYRCRRCGQPKRGHICAALTLGETPAGDELQQKAQALSKLSADRMRPTSAASEMSTLPPSEPSLSAQSTPQLPYERASSPDLPPLQPVAAPLTLAQQAMLPVVHAVVPNPNVPMLPSSEPVAFAVPIKGEPMPIAVPVTTAATPLYEPVVPPMVEPQMSEQSAQLDEAQLDDFLEELQLHELTSSGKDEQCSLSGVTASLAIEQMHPAASLSLQPTGCTYAPQSHGAMLSQASLQQLLHTLAAPELTHGMPHQSRLAAY